MGAKRLKEEAEFVLRPRALFGLVNEVEELIGGPGRVEPENRGKRRGL